MEVIEKYFDTAFESIEGIKKLRELILTLAMQGKLVPQDPNDPPASKLLKDVEAEKLRLAKEGKIKSNGPLPPIKPEEVPYELPKGWEWVRIGEIGIINPRNEADDSNKAGFVPMPLISEGYSGKCQFEERHWSEVKRGYTHFADGDIGMAKITPCFENAKSCIFSDLPNGIGAGTTELHIFRNSFNSIVPYFLLYYLKNPHYISKVVPNMTGSAGQKRVPTLYFSKQVFPLPSIPEQHRIVAKIDQLMAHCDELEKLHKERLKKVSDVHRSAINFLLDISNQENHNKGWRFISKNFVELYRVKENVGELRKVILQLAMQGKLVPQDPKDPPASELLKDVEAEKLRLAKEGKIKSNGPLPPIKPEEVPYELPRGWVWAHFGNIGNIFNGNSINTREKEMKYTGANGLPYITTKDVGYGLDVLNYANGVYIPESEKKFKIAHKGTVLICAEGGSAGKKCGITDQDICFGNKLFANELFGGIPSKFLLFFYLTPKFSDFFTEAMTGIIGGVSIAKFLKLFVPLPPLPEQHRIVAKIDQLMILCDEIEKYIDVANSNQTELLNVVMEQV